MHRNRRHRIAELETELRQVEQDIEHIANRTREMANELGARYAVFRCVGKQYDNTGEIRNSDIMKLSRETDVCIDSIYSLEQKRRELLDEIRR